MHKLLERQLRKYFASGLPDRLKDKEFSDFCLAIEQAYTSHDDDRELLERALELSSRELNEKNRDLQESRTIAETASKAKSSFLANMSHEMRTPLNAIIGYSELILEELTELNHDEIAVELEKIRTSGNHLLSLINNVLDLAKIESGQMDVSSEEFDLASLVHETCTILQSHALKNKNKLGYKIETESTVIRSDRSKIKQILINLTGNALKFTQNGEVTLNIFAPNPEQIGISISDTGIGISPEKIKKLFQPFVQAESDTQKKFGGTGLGLAISSNFAELIQAQLNVESKEGHGTTFTLRLDTQKKSTQNEEVLPQKHRGHNSNYNEDVGRRILLIDDDPNAITLMQRFLGRHGFECISLKSGNLAVEETLRIKPVAVLLDVFMPGIDGWATLSKLKENPQTAHVPVIFTTMTDEVSLGLSLGALDYFTKPIDWNRLASVLASVAGAEEQPVVLLTEAESPSKKSMLQFFNSKNWKTIEAENTKIFRTKLSQRNYNLIILDCQNPEISSVECVSELRDCALNRDTPVLCFTKGENELAQNDILKGRLKFIFSDNQDDPQKVERAISNLIAGTRKGGTL